MRRICCGQKVGQGLQLLPWDMINAFGWEMVDLSDMQHDPNMQSVQILGEKLVALLHVSNHLINIQPSLVPQMVLYGNGMVEIIKLHRLLNWIPVSHG